MGIGFIIGLCFVPDLAYEFDRLREEKEAFRGARLILILLNLLIS